MKATVSEQVAMVELVFERAHRALAAEDFKEATRYAFGSVMMVMEIKYPERFEEQPKLSPDKQAKVDRFIREITAFEELGDDFLGMGSVVESGSEEQHSTGMSRSSATDFVNRAAAVLAAAKALAA